MALNTRKEGVMCRTLKSIQKLVKSADYIGQALVPYYRLLNKIKETLRRILERSAKTTHEKLPENDRAERHDF